MFNRLLQRALHASLALSAAAFAFPAMAQASINGPSFTSEAVADQTHELFYNVWRMGIAISYRGMGYDDGDGNWVSLAGSQITSAGVVLTYTAEPGDDIASITMHMQVPVIGAQSAFFEVTGDQLVQTAPGVYHYALTTDLFNGTVHGGRFGIEAFGRDANGNPVSLGGELSADTGFYFTVATAPVPEPTTALMLLGGLGALPLLARRRAAKAAAAA